MIDVILCLGAVIVTVASWGLLMIGIGTIIQRCRKAQKNKTIKANGGKQMNDIKAGYRVVVVEEGCFTPPKGTVGTVVKPGDNGVWVLWPNGQTAWCLNERVELVRTSARFKVGDRVSFISRGLKEREGDVGTVLSVEYEQASICVKFDNAEYKWWVPAERLKLAQTQKQTECENSKPENELMFAPGDKVRYTGDVESFCYPERGTVGEVVRSERYGTTIVRWPDGTVSFNGAAYEWWVGNHNLELVRDEINVGDIVRMKNTKEALEFHKEHPSWYPKQGVIGRVVGIEQDMAMVEWEAGSVERNSSGGFAWYIAQKRLSVVFAKK